MASKHRRASATRFRFTSVTTMLYSTARQLPARSLRRPPLRSAASSSASASG